MAYMDKYNNKRVPRGERRRRSPIRGFMKLFLATSFLILAGLFLHNCYGFFTTSPYFMVKDIEVIGNNRLAAEYVVGRIGLDKNQNIFLTDISAISAKVRDNPWIKDVSVSRLLPDKLSVKLVERHPVAIINKGGIYLVGDDGMVMERIEDYSGLPLPLLLGTEVAIKRVGDRLKSDLAASLIDIIAVTAESSFVTGKGIKSIEMLHNNKINLVTREGNISIIIDGLYLDEGLEKLDRIEEFIGTSFVKKIDLSFKGQVVVI